MITVTTRLVSHNINWRQTTEYTKIGVSFNNTKNTGKNCKCQAPKTHSVHKHQKHGENARPLCPSGVDNQTNYVHSPPKGCTATPRPKVMSLSLLWDCPCLYVLDLFQSQPLSGKGSPGERSAFPEKDSSPLFCVLSPSLAHL